jgi:hypothetical protein
MMEITQMVFEDVHHGRPEAVNLDLNSKLFDCCYGKCGTVNDKADTDRTAQCAAEAKETPPAKESKETPEQRLDNKIKEHFGDDVLEHMKQWNWLIDNRDKLEAGFKKISGQEAWDVARRMNELSKVDGKSLIYLSKTEGQTSGTLLQKRYDIYLRRGSLRSDNQIGHVYH